MSFVGAPVMTSMVAAPTVAGTTTIGAPTMTSMVASQPASVYMPAAATAAVVGGSMVAAPMAAPGTFIAAGPSMVETSQLVSTPSVVVGAPQMYAAPQASVVEYAVPQQFGYEYAMPQQAVGQFNVPGPVRLTEGLTEPAKLEQEKVAYGKALEAQLKKQSDAVLAEATIQKQMLEQTAKTQVAQYALQVEEQQKMAYIRIDQQAQTTLTGLREAAITQQTAMEERAALTIEEFKKKRAIEEMSMKSYTLQKQYYEQEMKLQQQYAQVMQKGSKAVVTSPVPQIPAAGII